MEWSISDEVRLLTTQCKKDFSCLKGRRELCSVEHCVNETVHFIIRCKQPTSCSYQLSFGEGMVCLCPIRKALYNRYKL
jgi:hypothetical protein